MLTFRFEDVTIGEDDVMGFAASIKANTHLLHIKYADSRHLLIYSISILFDNTAAFTEALKTVACWRPWSPLSGARPLPTLGECQCCLTTLCREGSRRRLERSGVVDASARELSFSSVTHELRFFFKDIDDALAGTIGEVAASMPFLENLACVHAHPVSCKYLPL